MEKILCPSILNLPIDRLKEEILQLDQAGVDIFHVDIMDGSFVPNFGMSMREMDLIRANTDKLIDCHMMVMQPHRHVEAVADHGADIIYIHPESEICPSETLNMIRSLDKRAGLVLNPCTSLESVRDMLPITDYLMVMGVNPGYAGRSFMDYLLPKFERIAQLRKDYNFQVVLDGGATREVISTLYHRYQVEGFVLGKQELFFQDRPYDECIRFVRSL